MDILDKLGLSTEVTSVLGKYLQKRCRMFTHVQTLVLRDRDKFLKKIYQPLTFTLDEGQTCSILEGLKINGYEPELTQIRRLLIVDSAGMGKSTMTKLMFLDIVDRGIAIPIYVELRRLSFQKSLIEEIAFSVMEGLKGNQLLSFIELMKTGKVIVFFDGFDETGLDIRNLVIGEIKKFTERYPNNSYILTSRPESELSELMEFKRVRIKPLNKNEAFELLSKYDDNGSTSKLLVQKLNDKVNHAIDDYLKNPLLVSLLFAAFDYKQTIPLKKHLFYSQVYEAYFEKHDLTKGDCEHEKKSGLDIFNFDKVLRVLGYHSLVKQKIEYSKEEIIQLIGMARQFCADLSFKNEDFLYDLLHTVPLFSKDGVFYRWSHKSLQEYFAARFIAIDAKEQHDTILLSMYNSDKIDKYINLLDIYFDIDNYEFNRVLTLQFLNEFSEYFNKNYISIAGISEHSVKLRVSLLYDRKCYISYADKKFSKNEALSFLLNEISRFIKNDGEPMSQASFFEIDGLTFCRQIMYKKKMSFINLLKDRNVPIFSKFDKIKGYPDEKMRMKVGDFKKIAECNDFSYSQDAYDFANFSLSINSENKSYSIIDYEKVRDYANQIYSMISMKNNMASMITGI